MTNTTYFYGAIREEWSASTTPNETPRPSSVDAANHQTLVEPSPATSASSSSSGAMDGVLGEGGIGKSYKGLIDENTSTAFKPVRDIAVSVKGRNQQEFQGQEKGLKVILKLDVYDDKNKTKAMKVVSGMSGIETISMDMKDRKLTMTGNMDPVGVVNKLRKSWHTELLSVGPVKKPEKKVETKKE